MESTKMVGTEYPKVDTKGERRLMQARLAHFLRKTSAMGLLGRQGQSSTAGSSGGKSGTSWFSLHLMDPEEMEMSAEPLYLPQVVMTLPCGKELSGTLEAHVNGVKFTTANGDTDLMWANVRGYFLRFADEKCQPLMLFCLYEPHMVGTTETMDIQFRLPPGKDSDNIEKDEQPCYRNEELIDFAYQVQESQWTCTRKPRTPLVTFQALEECEFDGVSPEGESATYALTFTTLVVLQSFTVYPLCDIEIVNLALTEPERIDMTVVFKDLERSVLEIRSIPSNFLTDIELRLNSCYVKHYVNQESKIKWNVLVREIAESPEEFRKLGGWLSLYLEGDLALAYYARSDLDS